MNSLTEEEKAYIAGFMSTKRGRIEIKEWKSGAISFKVFVWYPTRKIIDWFQDTTGIGVIEEIKGKYVWRVRDPEMKEFLETILPYLLFDKREEAERIIKLLDLIERMRILNEEGD